MKLKKTEIVIIALTLAFFCFTGGYFAGRRGAVNIVPAVTERSSTGALEAAPPVSPGETKTEERKSAEEESPDTTSDAETKIVPESSDAGTPQTLDYNKIDINTATQGTLTDLPGIGPALAERIIEYREQKGGFDNIEELKQVSGIGDKRYEAIKELVYAS